MDFSSEYEGRFSNAAYSIPSSSPVNSPPTLKPFSARESKLEAQDTRLQTQNKREMSWEVAPVRRAEFGPMGHTRVCHG